MVVVKTLVMEHKGTTHVGRCIIDFEGKKQIPLY
jgi:hypothetical protein